MDENNKILLSKFVLPEEERWDIRYHTDSPCCNCRTYHCSLQNPYCPKYKIFYMKKILEELNKVKEKKIKKEVKKQDTPSRRVNRSGARKNKYTGFTIL